ncbi:10938_t:CDS:2, partial [Gigaspora rosea]
VSNGRPNINTLSSESSKECMKLFTESGQSTSKFEVKFSEMSTFTGGSQDP